MGSISEMTDEEVNAEWQKVLDFRSKNKSALDDVESKVLALMASIKTATEDGLSVSLKFNHSTWDFYRDSGYYIDLTSKSVLREKPVYLAD
jgi:hypothetical protein